MSATIKQPIALVTGMEHAGTTYLSSLIKCHPLVNGDFECGVLLAESPADFRNISPFYGWMLRAKNPKQWGISEDKMEIILASQGWQEMYQNIVRFSPLFKNGAVYLLDKTPGYLPVLNSVLKKTAAPCIVIYKKTVFQYLSYKKRNISLYDFQTRYLSYMSGLVHGMQNHPQRIFVLNYESLLGDTLGKLRIIFRFIGLDFMEEYFASFFSEKQPGNIRPDYNLENEQSLISNLSEEEKTVLNKISLDTSLAKLAI